MDNFFKVSELHAREVKQFENARQATWDNLQAQYKQQIPIAEKQRFSQEWGQRQKEMIARQHKELSKVVEQEKPQKVEPHPPKPTIIKKPLTIDELKEKQLDNQRKHQLSELLESRTTQKRLDDKIKEMEANRAAALKDMERREQLTEQERKAEDKKRFEEKLKEMEEQKQQILMRL